MPETNLLTRTLALGSYGKDVDAIKRTVYRGLDKRDGGNRLKTHMSRKPLETPQSALIRRRTYGAFFRSDVNKLKTLMKLTANGKVEPTFFAKMKSLGYADSFAIDLLEQYAIDHKPAPPVIKYVEPRQGFSSLDRRLWDEYTIGRNMGLWDLGTYNKASTLPSGAPSDHSVDPAVAFDLGFSPQTGYDNAKARKFFHLMAGAEGIHYVILGNKIWSVEKGLHSYSDSYSHAGHIHVSGWRH